MLNSFYLIELYLIELHLVKLIVTLSPNQSSNQATKQFYPKNARPSLIGLTQSMPNQFIPNPTAIKPTNSLMQIRLYKFIMIFSPSFKHITISTIDKNKFTFVP